MPILLPPSLEASDVLKAEGYDVQNLDEANRLGKPRLKIGLLNLMPKKETTEHHFARVLTHPSLNIELVLLHLRGHESRHVRYNHLHRYYHHWQTAILLKLDSFIVTGAPVEHLDFDQVGYIEELYAVFDWLKAKRIPSLFVCWGGQAAAHYFCGLEKEMLEEKCLGLFEHSHTPHPLFEGLEAGFKVPVARNTKVPLSQIEVHPDVSLLSQSDGSGAFVAAHNKLPHHYVFNHFEYTAETIGEEYWREINAGVAQPLPHGYYPNNDSSAPPPHHWRNNAERFYHNWLGMIAG